MSRCHNMCDLHDEQQHRRQNRDYSPRTRVSAFALADDSDLNNTRYGSGHGPGHDGIRRGAIDFGRDPRDDHPRRGAVDLGRTPHGDLIIPKNDHDEDIEGSLRVRRGSAPGRDDFRGFLGSRGFERRPANSRLEEDLEIDHSVRGEKYPLVGKEGYQRRQQLRGRTERPCHSICVSHDAHADVEDGFEPRELRRAAPLSYHMARGKEERAQYVYYEPHGPRREAGR